MPGSSTAISHRVCQQLRNNGNAEAEDSQGNFEEVRGDRERQSKMP
jgi:hypothetical protein